MDLITIAVLTVALWATGSIDWIKEKTRQLKLDNDIKAKKLKELKEP